LAALKTGRDFTGKKKQKARTEEFINRQRGWCQKKGDHGELGGGMGPTPMRSRKAIRFWGVGSLAEEREETVEKRTLLPRN